MSLDLYLRGEPVIRAGSSGIFIRMAGEMVEITRAEWDRRNPGREPVVFQNDDEPTSTIWHRNITHNLNKMAEAAGLYMALWRPDEIGATHARILVDKLEAGIAKLKAEPDAFKRLNPSNGWGDYDLLLDFAQSFLAACKAYPDATVYANR